MDLLTIRIKFSLGQTFLDHYVSGCSCSLLMFVYLFVCLFNFFFVSCLATILNFNCRNIFTIRIYKATTHSIAAITVIDAIDIITAIAVKNDSEAGVYFFCFCFVLFVCMFLFFPFRILILYNSTIIFLTSGG